MRRDSRVLNLLSLYHRRRRGDMITVYQVLRQGVDVDATQFFTLATTGNTRGHHITALLRRPKAQIIIIITRGHEWKLLKPRAVSRVRRNAFSVRVINEWNALPPSVVAAPSLNAFKARLDRHWAHAKHDILTND